MTDLNADQMFYYLVVVLTLVSISVSSKCCITMAAIQNTGMTEKERLTFYPRLFKKQQNAYFINNQSQSIFYSFLLIYSNCDVILTWCIM